MTATIERFKRHKAFQGATEFFGWWRDQLIQSLPQDWREKLHTETATYSISMEADHIAAINDRGEELFGFARSDDPAIVASQVAAAVKSVEEDQPEFFAVISDDKVLMRTLMLPAATEDSLHQVLRYEMDKHTPFKAEEVYFDATVLDHVAGGTKIRVGLAVVRRQVIDEIVGFLSQRGIALHGVDIASDSGPVGVNLLPAEQRTVRDRRQIRLNLLFAVAFLILLYTVMWQSVVSREQALAVYDEEVEAVKAEAETVMELRKRLNDAREAASFLAERRASQTTVIGLLAELTELLPDDTWLQRLQITGETLQLSGQTSETARIVGLLQEEARNVCEPNIRGAVTPDRESGKERFTIEAELCRKNKEQS